MILLYCLIARAGEAPFRAFYAAAALRRVDEMCQQMTTMGLMQKQRDIPY